MQLVWRKGFGHLQVKSDSKTLVDMIIENFKVIMVNRQELFTVGLAGAQSYLTGGKWIDRCISIIPDIREIEILIDQLILVICWILFKFLLRGPLHIEISSHLYDVTLRVCMSRNNRVTRFLSF